MPVTSRKVPFNALDRQNSGALAERMAEVSRRVIDSGWYVLGAEVSAFEREFADYCGTQHAIGVGNGSDALELALASLDLPEGSEIAVAPNAAMYATLAILANGFSPRFVDVDPRRATMDAQAFAASITPRTRAVVVTHLYGALADIEPISAIARQHGLKIVEDCAQAHGAERGSRRAGSFGDIACFSFYPTKNLGALGDGGAVTTSDDGLAHRVRQLRQYGWREKYNVTLAHGRNSRLDEMQAALLRVKLPLVDGWNARRRVIATRYSQGIRHHAIEAPPPPGADHVAHLYVVRSEHRDALREHLQRSGIGVDVHYPIPDHRQPIFGDRYATVNLPVAEHLARTSLSLPCFAELTDEEVALVVDACNAWSA